MIFNELRYGSINTLKPDDRVVLSTNASCCKLTLDTLVILFQDTSILQRNYHLITVGLN